MSNTQPHPDVIREISDIIEASCQHGRPGHLSLDRCLPLLFPDHPADIWYKADVEKPPVTPEHIRTIAAAVTALPDEEKQKIVSVAVCFLGLGDEHAPAIAELLRACPNAQGLQLTKNELTAASLPVLTEAIADSPDFRSLMLGGNAIGNGTAGEALIQLIESAPQLNSLEVSENPLDDRDIRPLAEYMKYNDTLTTLHINNTRIGAEGHYAMCEMLGENRELSTFTLRQPEAPPEYEQRFTDAMHNSGNKNLFYVTLLPDKVMDPHSKQYRTQAIDTFNALMEDNPDVLSHPYADRAFTETHRGTFQLMMTWNNTQLKENLLRYQQVTADLPTLDTDTADPLHALFTPDATGFAPLDNPRTWRNEQTVWNALAAADVALTPELMQRQTEKGTSFLESALLGGRTSRVLPALHAAGLQVQNRELISAEGGPTPLYEGLIRRGEGHKLFTATNWRGATVDSMMEAMKHLPDEQRAKIENPHQLRHAVQLASASTQCGR